MDEVVKTVLTVFLILGGIIAFCFVLAYVLNAYMWTFQRIDDLLYLRQNRRILKRLEELKRQDLPQLFSMSDRAMRW
jgi:hypothetical protein